MNRLSKTMLVGLLLSLVSILVVSSGCQTNYQTGTLQGGVTIGPVFPGPERPGETRPVPPEVFAARKVMVYDETGKNLIQTVDIRQIDQGATGYYSVQLKPGTYLVDINHIGIDSGGELPRKISLKAGETIIIDLDIDTGIR